MMDKIKATVQVLICIGILGLFAACVAVDENDPRLNAHKEAIEKGKERTQWINAADEQTKPNSSNQKELKTEGENKTKTGNDSKASNQNNTADQNKSSDPNNSSNSNKTNKPAELSPQGQPKTTTTKPGVKMQTKPGQANPGNAIKNSGTEAERIQNKTKDRLKNAQEALKEESKNTKEQILKQSEATKNSIKEQILKQKEASKNTKEQILKEKDSLQKTIKNNILNKKAIKDKINITNKKNNTIDSLKRKNF